MLDRDIIRKQIIARLLATESVTRPELVDELELRPATLYEIIDQMKEDGLLAEPERRGKKTGRKASPLCFDPDYAWVAGIDFQAGYTNGVLIDLQGHIRAKTEIQSPGNKDAASGKKEIFQAIDNLKRHAGDSWRRVKGLAFADPGLVDIENGISLKAVNIPGWECIPAEKWLEDAWKVPAKIFPSTLTRTYMEYHELLPEPPPSLFHMELDIGIGGGFIKNGELFVGDTGCGMEVGHLVVCPDGPLCQCGNRGCLEAMAGEAGIRKKVTEMVSSGVQTELSSSNFSIPAFISCVNRNDKAACSLAYELCEYIGLGLSSIVTILNPSEIILSGKLARLDHFIIEAVKRTMSMHCFPSALENLNIRFTSLDKTATATGAALLYRKQFLEN